MLYKHDLVHHDKRTGRDFSARRGRDASYWPAQSNLLVISPLYMIMLNTFQVLVQRCLHRARKCNKIGVPDALFILSFTVSQQATWAPEGESLKVESKEMNQVVHARFSSSVLLSACGKFAVEKGAYLFKTWKDGEGKVIRLCADSLEAHFLSAVFPAGQQAKQRS
jgi:hypothetical protein